MPMSTYSPAMAPACYTAPLRHEPEILSVQGNRERWKELCEQAAGEQGPRKLHELTKQINDLLLGKQHRLDTAAEEPKKE